MDKTIERAKVKLKDDDENFLAFVCKNADNSYYKFIGGMPAYSGLYWRNGWSHTPKEIEPIPELENVAPEDSLRRVV